SRTDHTAFGESIPNGTGLRSTAQGYWGTIATRQGYGLTERDEATGLDHTWFRKNEGASGRWTSPDPYKGSMDLDDPQSFNRYSYVLNQPTNFVDPSGLFWMVDYGSCRVTGVILYGSWETDTFFIWNGNYDVIETCNLIWAGPMPLPRDGDPTAGGGGIGGTIVPVSMNSQNTDDEPKCNRNAQMELRRQTVIQEREIIKKEFEINERDLFDAGIDAGICLGGLVTATVTKIPQTISTALVACGLTVGRSLAVRIAVSAAKIAALNFRREKKEYDMNCGESGVIRGVLKRIGLST
ncbi:MAG: RHS repeat-associated core domain-containing protein, partial [Pyrinomonadaceae bacterium]